MDANRDNLENTVTDFLRRHPFSISSSQKEDDFLDIINQLTEHHVLSCDPYRRIIGPVFGFQNARSLVDIPFIPVQLFKSLSLSSVPQNDVSKTMTSSGTTGQAVSKIMLDKPTASGQTRALTQIMKSVLGPMRVPMLIIDSSSVAKDRDMFSARGAGIRGFSMFGKDVDYALDENMKLRTTEVVDFVARYKEETIFLFGFTFMVWQHFCEELERTNSRLEIPNGVLLHGGGWKKLASLEISNDQFRTQIANLTGITRVMNYYGMVEQTGSIYLECSEGYLHASAYSDIVIRDVNNFRPVQIGEVGVIQVISMLPMSYPGHSLLTEDMGTIIGHDDCLCGRTGTYFVVHGRMKDAEVRGCSDTYVV